MPDTCSIAAADGQQVAVWRGELLWAMDDLPDAAVIDASQVSLAGSWLHGWLRQRGQRKIVGANRQLRQQLQQAGLPILWYSTMKEAGHADLGISGAEKDMLWE